MLLHHERWDGTGYPHRLKGEKIPLEARIVCLADAVDVMSSDRPYRKARGFADIIQEIKDRAGTHFDPNIAQAFLCITESMGESLLINTVVHESNSAKEVSYFRQEVDPIYWPAMNQVSAP